MYALSVLLGIAFYAALIGLVIFAAVLGHRAQRWGHDLSVSPERCRACGERGWHYPGCGRLDRLDAPRREDTR